MAEAYTRGLVRFHDQALRARRDEAGLTMLAYALGAALVIIPLATALFLFGGDTVTEAGDRVDGVIANS
jgi:hypothetical protein